MIEEQPSIELTYIFGGRHMKTKAEIKEWLQAHKKQIALGVGTTVCAGIWLYIAVNKRKAIDVDKVVKVAVDNTTPQKILDFENKVKMANWGKYCIDDVWYEDGFLNLIVNDFNIGDFGNLADTIMQNVDGAQHDTGVTAMMGVFVDL